MLDDDYTMDWWIGKDWFIDMLIDSLLLLLHAYYYTLGEYTVLIGATTIFIPLPLLCLLDYTILTLLF